MNVHVTIASFLGGTRIISWLDFEFAIVFHLLIFYG